MKNLTFENCLESRKLIDSKIDEYHNILNSFPVNELGLISDIYRKTPEYIEAKNQFNFWFKQLQNLNLYINRNFKKENREFQRQKRFSKI